jgi:zinc/manganese transport system substrate-binding protein/manganese/iron transport system substrate-binding protein
MTTQDSTIRFSRSRAVAVAFGAIALALTGCSTAGAPSSQEEIRVVATTTQLADFTSAVVGNDGVVSGLILPNSSAHQFDPSAKNLLDVGDAQALVANGAGLEPWLQDLMDAGAFSGDLVVASDGIVLQEGGHDHADEHAGEEHAGEEHAGEEHAGEEHAGEEHAGEEKTAQDPHVWTAPQNAIAMVNNIARGLSDVRPDLADTFAKNAAAYVEKLALLDTWATEAFASVAPEKRLLITNHDAFGYFVDAYGITYVGSIMPSLDDNAEPSAQEIDALIERIKQEGAVAVFSESTLSDKLATTIAREAQVAVYSGDDALYADSLGPEGTDGATYLGATIHNVTVLVTAWGGTVPPLPAGLSS